MSSLGIHHLLEGEDNEADAVHITTLTDVGRLIDDADVLGIHHGDAGVAPAFAGIIDEPLVPRFALIAGGAEGNLLRSHARAPPHGSWR